MNRPTFNIIIDTLAAAVMLGMIATGTILRFILPPGSGRRLALWTLTRHQWGDLHFWLALAVVGVVILHLALHWSYVVSVVHHWVAGADRAAPRPRLRVISAVATLLIVCGALGAFWWSSLGSPQPVYAPGSETTERPTSLEKIRGSMTLAETAAVLGYSVDHVRGQLGLPANVSDGARLGEIARQRGISVQEMRRRLTP